MACLLAHNACSQAVSHHAAGGLAPNAPDSKLGYIRVATFSKQTAENVGEALKELKAQVGSTLRQHFRAARWVMLGHADRCALRSSWHAVVVLRQCYTGTHRC